MKKTICVLGVAGTLFSGYLSGTKLFSHTCAFHETCPIFLGNPACYYGFGMFLAITIFSGLLVWKKIRESLALSIILSVSAFGTVFAGYFSLGELPLLVQNGFAEYTFGLPTCMLGLLFFIAVCIITAVSYFGQKGDIGQTV